MIELFLCLLLLLQYLSPLNSFVNQFRNILLQPITTTTSTTSCLSSNPFIESSLCDPISPSDHANLQQVDALCQLLGPKQLLQEVSQYLFSGLNPSYEWNEQFTTLKIKLSMYEEFVYTIEPDGEIVMKEFESAQQKVCGNNNRFENTKRHCYSYSHSNVHDPSLILLKEDDISTNQHHENSYVNIDVHVTGFGSGNINSNVQSNNFRRLATERKRLEKIASRQTVYEILRLEQYNTFLDKWLRRRISRNHSPKEISRRSFIEAVGNKSMVILIDIENVPDFRRYFFVDLLGDVKLSTPMAPQLVEAPPLSSSIDLQQLDWTDLLSERGGTSSRDYASNFNLNSNVDIYIETKGSMLTKRQDDDDILVLTYAHTKSSQSVWANRITPDNRKDAADVLMLFDLGALELLPSVRNIIMVTSDGFGQSAKACFALSENQRNVDYFNWVHTCSECARLLGRISF